MSASAKPAHYIRGVPLMRGGRVQVQPGAPLEFDDPPEPGPEVTETQRNAVRQIAGAVSAYLDAADRLLRTDFSEYAINAPGHLLERGTVFVFVCPDGVVIRFDASG